MNLVYGLFDSTIDDSSLTDGSLGNIDIQRVALFLSRDKRHCRRSEAVVGLGFVLDCYGFELTGVH